jgi:outer membrane protein TolC
MRSRFLSIGLFLFGLSCVAQDQSLSIARVASLVLGNDVAIRKSRETLKAAASNYKNLLANKKPQIGLSTGYSLDYTNMLVDEYGHEYKDFSTNSAFLGFSLEKLLWTHGTLSVNLGDQVSRAKGLIDSNSFGPFISQAPALSVSLEQLVLFNGKFIDDDLYKAIFRQGEIGYLRAAEENRITRNEALYGAIDLLFDVVKLRNDIIKINKAMELKQRGVENLQRNLTAGLVAETEVWEMRVELGKERENLLAYEYALKQKEGDLKMVLGIDGEEELNIDKVVLEPELEAAMEEGPEKIFLKNPTIRSYELSLENARLKKTINGANYASILNFSFDLSPHYSNVRTESSWRDSFADFWDEDSGWGVSLSAELNVPLYNGSKAKHQTAADEASEASLLEELAYQKEDMLLKRRMLILVQNNLQEKIELLQDNLLLKEKQAEVERELWKIGQEPELDVIEVEIEYFEKQNDLAAATMDLYLTRLNLLSLMGEDLEKVILN